MKFWIKLSLIVSLVMLLLGSVLFIYFYKAGADAVYVQLKQRFEGDTLEFMQNVDRFFFMRQSDIQLAANASVVRERNLDVKRITDELIRLRNIYRCYLSLSFYDMSGIRLADTSGLDIGENESERIFFKEAVKKGSSMAEDVDISPALNVPVAYFSALVRDGGGEPIGVVASRVPLHNFKNMGEGMKIEEIENAHIDILDRDGRVIYSSLRGHEFLSRSYIDKKVMNKVANGASEGFIKPHHESGLEYAEKNWFFSAFAIEPGYLDYKGNGWVGIAYIPEDAVYGPVRQMRNRMFLVFIVGLSAALVSVFFLSRRLVRPLHTLSKAAGDIGEGRFDVDVRIASKDEIGDLAGSFLRMKDSLRRYREEAESNKKSLELAVEKRTQQLKKSLKEVESSREVMLSILEDTTDARIALQNALDELKEKEEQLIRAGKLAGIGEMAAGVAHEINNPLTSILGYAQLTMANRSIDPEIKEDLKSIEREAKRCVTIIENLLNFARPLPLEKMRVDLHKIIDEAMRVVEYTLTRDKIDIVRNYCADLPPIFADGDQLHQVVLNLVMNAANAMPNGGTLTICTSHLVKREAPAGYASRDTLHDPRATDRNFVEISVADTGGGIPPENIGRIFEPFFTTSYSKGKKGTGLGLSISYAIVKEHGGTIEVESKVGKGSVFRVMLPV